MLLIRAAQMDAMQTGVVQELSERIYANLASVWRSCCPAAVDRLSTSRATFEFVAALPEATEHDLLRLFNALLLAGFDLNYASLPDDHQMILTDNSRTVAARVDSLIDRAAAMALIAGRHDDAARLQAFLRVDRRPPPRTPNPAGSVISPCIKNWIVIELYFPDGKPAAGVRYEIELPGGGTRTGVLDARGSALEKNIENAGLAKVRFPDISEFERLSSPMRETLVGTNSND